MDQPKVERVLHLMILMTGNVNYTVEELAARLNTSCRSIYRYIETFKEVGFVVHRLGGGVFRLGKESRCFKDISQLIHFTDEEAHIVNSLIEALDDTNLLKANLRKKLTSVYDCTALAHCVVKGRNAANVNAIIEAIENKQQVILKDYASSHAGKTSDRLVEPFGFTTNYIQIWCFEPNSGANKLFNTARIFSVQPTDTKWQYTKQHHMGYIDIFRITGFNRQRIRLELGVMAHNLLTEEYPLSERDLTQIDGMHWLLDTKVCNLAGVGRFVLGMAHDIRIVDTPELEAYVKNYVAKNIL